MLLQSLVLSKNMLTKAISYCPKKYLIILNPYGGAKLASSYLENVVEPMFFEAGFKFDVVATKYNGHAKGTTSSIYPKTATGGK